MCIAGVGVHGRSEVARHRSGRVGGGPRCRPEIAPAYSGTRRVEEDLQSIGAAAFPTKARLGVEEEAKPRQPPRVSRRRRDSRTLCPSCQWGGAVDPFPAPATYGARPGDAKLAATTTPMLRPAPPCRCGRERPRRAMDGPPAHT